MKTTPDSLYRTQGGTISVGTLRLLAETAAEHGTGKLYFTTDQCVRLPGISDSRFLLLQQRLPGTQRDEEMRAPNIVTTAPVAGLGVGRAWLRQSVFADVLAGFDFAPKAAVVIADPAQPYLPALVGQIQVLASTREDQWQLRLVSPQGAVCEAPGMVRGAQVAEAVKRIDEQLHTNLTENTLADLLSDLLRGAPREALPHLPRHALAPGLTTLPQPSLGWEAGFLQALCLHALKQEITTLGISPWRGLMLPAGDEECARHFDELCLLERIAPDPNPWRRWLLVAPPLEREADAFARLLFARCPANPGFSIALQGADSPPADTHFTLRPQPRPRLMAWQRTQRYNLVARHQADQLQIATGVSLEQAADAVLARIATTLDTAPLRAEQPAPTASTRETQRCTECLTEYDPAHGDPRANIPAGTPFHALPATWSCPVCDATPKAYAMLRAL